MVVFEFTGERDIRVTTVPLSVTGDRGALRGRAAPMPKRNSLETGWVFR